MSREANFITSRKVYVFSPEEQSEIAFSQPKDHEVWKKKFEARLTFINFNQFKNSVLKIRVLISYLDLLGAGIPPSSA